MKSVIISLVSDQTIPNILLLKYYSSLDLDYYFISTDSMERRGRRESILKAASLQDDVGNTLIVNEYDINDIVSKLSICNWSRYARIIINLTGGTKIMSLATYRFFSAFPKAEIYYVMTEGNKLLSLNIISGIIETIDVTLNPQDYLIAYGFNGTSPERHSYPLTNEQMLRLTLDGTLDNYINELSFLRSRRSNGVKSKDLSIVEPLLKTIEFTPQAPDKLSPAEVKYLTGEWFEDYVAERVKSVIGIPGSEMISGYTITKTGAASNELDVAFMHAGKFHVIECKTSIINQIIDDKNKIKNKNILGETLYKADSLKNKFGLFAKYFICTLTDFEDYKKIGQNEKNQMEGLIDRAELSRIKLIDRDILLDDEKLRESLCS